VGLSVSPSLEIVVAIWGIIKALGAYVPLDPSYPFDRLKYMVADARVQLILTQSQWQGGLEELKIPLINLDTDWSFIAHEEEQNLEIVNERQDLAYVIYTSGSTGRPKGVMITHDNLISFVDTVQSSLGVNSQGIHLLSASVNYALSVRQIFVPLCSGARLVVASEEQRVNPLAQLEIIQQAGVTAVDFVPTFWRTCNQLLISQPVDVRQRLLDNQLQQIVSVGEPLHAEIPRIWRDTFNHKARIVNIFGQTETTGIVAYKYIQDGTWQDSEVVPIGKAVPTAKLDIMDSDLKTVPDFEVGELCVSTPCLGQGYINNPDQTADKFVEDQMQPGERLYRTGDLARRLPNGDIQHLGRIDQQIKIRGIRVELAEIEAILGQYEGVENVVVNPVERRSGGNQLVAYLILEKDHQVSIEELRNYLMNKLPDYMVPTIFLTLEEFPLTQNGKVDRRALPVPEQNYQVKDHYIPPRDDLERSLVELWEEILAVGPIGIRDDFQSLGGDSLLAARVIARVEEIAGKRLPISYFTDVHTVEDLAATFYKEGWQQNQSSLVALQPHGSKSKFFIIHGVGGHLLRFSHLAQHFAPDYPLFGLQSRGLNGNGEPLQCIEDMAAYYIKEILMLQSEGPY
jgi:aspartate racemase